MKHFDTHCHLNGQFYPTETIDKDLFAAVEKHVDKILLPGTGEDDSLLAIQMAKKSPNLFAAAGVHPSDAVSLEAVKFLEKIDPKDIVAVGETGLDLHYEDNPHIDRQKEVFIKHIEYAQKHDLPLIIHSRDATKETYDILKKYKVNKFVMHAFSDSLEWANKFIELGGYISVSGVITFKTADMLKEVVKNVPLDRLVVETDSPFLTPAPHRGENNKPLYVRFVADAICFLREEGEKNIKEALYENACKLFNIK